MGLDDFERFVSIVRENFKDGGVKATFEGMSIEIAPVSKDVDVTLEQKKRIENQSEPLSFDEMFGAKEDFNPYGR